MKLLSVEMVKFWVLRTQAKKTKSHLFIGVSSVPVKLMALALLTSISIPPNIFTAFCTASTTAPSSRMSTAQGRHFPPASSTIKNKYTISELPKASLSKRGLVHNHSYENEFNLHVNEISFSYERMSTKTRFEKEAKGNSEMAY